MSEIFDEAFFQKLSRLKLAMNLRLDRGMSGSRKSSAKGASVEFSDFREYLPGDDIRRIDWNVYGRLGKLYVKEFMEEQEARYRIMIDSSRSMDFGQAKKSVMALQVAAAFTWLVLSQLDRAELYTMADGRLDRKSSSVSRGSFQNALRALEGIEFTGGTAIDQAVRACNIQGKGITILISDFLDPGGAAEAVRYLTYKKQDILLVQILAREEVEILQEGTVAFKDLETGEEVRVTMTGQTIRMYEDRLQEHCQSLESLAARYGCRYLRILSDEPLEKAVFETMKEKGIFA
ncbi:MAG: DUF58 domain-containing protein [Lachnospiraceae bacterium]|nr:DUF58 domain-containing protein [Lachnospiraceae bacterium]